jgi:hypothetical protein
MGTVEPFPIDVVGGMTIDVFEYFAPGSIVPDVGWLAASSSKLIDHQSYGFVYNYAKLRVYHGGRVLVSAKYVDPKTFEERMSEAFECRVGNEFVQGGAYFFRE